MITSKDLMIGDWVQIIEPDKYAGAKCTISLIQEGDGCYYRVFIKDANYGFHLYDIFQDDIAPIPLTPEILKKNGFKQGKGFEQRWYIAEVYDKRITFYHSNTCWSLKIDKGILPLLNNIYIHSVHELQHALRLCGIEKEITI